MCTLQRDFVLHIARNISFTLRHFNRLQIHVLCNTPARLNKPNNHTRAHCKNGLVTCFIQIWWLHVAAQEVRIGSVHWGGVGERAR